MKSFVKAIISPITMLIDFFKNNKICNFRPLFFVFMFFASGIMFANFLNINSTLYIILFALFFLISVCVLIGMKKLSLLILAAVCIYSGIFGFNFVKFKFEKITTFTNTVEVVGKVAFCSNQKYNYQVIYIDDLKIDNKNIDGKIMLKVTDYSDAGKFGEVGNVLKFNAVLNNCDLYEFSDEIPSTFFVDNNIKYFSTVYASNVNLIDFDFSFAEKIRQQIQENITLGLSNENAILAYSALFGDDKELYIDTETTFSISGITHLIAVSGSNIAIIVFVLVFLFGLMKIKKPLQLMLIVPVLFFYAYLCNFSISVLRAVIMAVVLLLAPLVKREYDSLSSLSFAGILILIYSPLAVFSAQFILSFCCVFGIIFLTKPIKNLFYKIKIRGRLNTAISVSLAAQIGVLFPLIFFFHNIQLLAIITNVLVLPLFSIAFSVVFIVAFLTLISPYFAYALYAVNPIFSIIKLITSVICAIPFARVETVAINFLSVLVYSLLIFVIGRFCLLEKFTKSAIVCFLITALVVNTAIMVYIKV